MPFFSKSTYVAFFLACTCALTHTFPALAELPPVWPHEKSDLKADPRIIYGELENGLRYAVMPNQTPKNQASVRLLFDVGSKHEYDDERGIAHFIEHMTFNGSDNVPEDEMVKILERHGLAFGADANAFTSYDRTVYQLDLPNMKQETVDTVFMLMRETASNVTFDATAVEKERGIILAEKRRTNIHAEKVQNARSEFLFPRSRGNQRKPIGTEEGISSVTREQMLQFYHQFYRPEKAFFVIVGDFETNTIIDKIKDTFSDWQAVGEPRDTHYADDTVTGIIDEHTSRHFVNEKASDNISISFIRPFTEREDNRKSRLEASLAGAALSILNKRLQNLRMDGKVAYLGARSGEYAVKGLADVSTLGVSVEPAQWKEGLRDALLEINRATSHGVTGSELKELLANLRTAHEYGVNTKHKQPSGHIANQILGSFAADVVSVAPETTLEIFGTFAANVTTDSLNKKMQHIWVPTPAKIFFVSETEMQNEGNITETLLSIYNTSMNAALEKHETTETQTFAYTDFGTPGHVTKRANIDDLDAVTVLFANNVMLNLKKTDLQDETVQMLMRFGDGRLSVPKTRPGLMTLYQGAFASGGTKAHSATELPRVLAGKTASIRAGLTSTAFTFSAAVTPGDLLVQLQLWTAYLTDPAYRKEPIQLFKRSLDSFYHRLDSSPAAVARYQIGKLIYSGDPRFYLPSKEEVDSIAAEELAQFLRPALEQSAIEITIVGDIDIEAVIAAVSNTVAALPERTEKPSPLTEERKVSFPAPAATRLHHKGGQDQAILRLYWPTADYSDVARSAKLDMLRSVLSDRLREAVREELGSSYAPSVSNVESDTHTNYGYFRISVDATPANIETIKSIIWAEIQELITTGVSEDDLERAVMPLLEGAENATKTNGYWLGLLSRAQTDPSTLRNEPIVINAWKNTTTKELQALAATYLVPESLFEIQILPYTPVSAVSTKAVDSTELMDSKEPETSSKQAVVP